MLQASLTPSTVAAGVVPDVGGNLLLASRPVGGEQYPPPRSPKECGFDEVVTQHLATQRRTSAENRKLGMLQEWTQPNDGIVTPVIPCIAIPERSAGREHRAIESPSELDDTAEQGFLQCGHRHRLNQADVRIRLHQSDQVENGRPGHQRVGVKHDHQVVAIPASPTELRDVPRLATDVPIPTTVVEGYIRTIRLQRPPFILFAARDLVIPGVTQHVDVDEPSTPDRTTN